MNKWDGALLAEYTWLCSWCQQWIFHYFLFRVENLWGQNCVNVRVFNLEVSWNETAVKREKFGSADVGMFHSVPFSSRMTNVLWNSKIYRPLFIRRNPPITRAGAWARTIITSILFLGLQSQTVQFAKRKSSHNFSFKVGNQQRTSKLTLGLQLVPFYQAQN